MHADILAHAQSADDAAVRERTEVSAETTSSASDADQTQFGPESSFAVVVRWKW